MIRTVEIITIRIAIDRFTLTSCSLDSIIISLFFQILNVLIKEIIFVELNPRKRVKPTMVSMLVEFYSDSNPR